MDNFHFLKNVLLYYIFLKYDFRKIRFYNRGETIRDFCCCFNIIYICFRLNHIIGRTWAHTSLGLQPSKSLGTETKVL